MLSLILKEADGSFSELATEPETKLGNIINYESIINYQSMFMQY